MAEHALNGAHGAPHARARSRAAAVSIVSNTLLIALKIVAGILTGSVAILTEALHSRDRPAGVLIAFFSVRRAEEPADAQHRYGHEKFENAAAAAEGMLILAGSAVIAFAAIRALIHGPELENLGDRHRRDRLRQRRQPRGLELAVPQGARDRRARRSRATPRTCAPTPTRRSACSSASRWSASPARTGWTRSSRC